ncbi:NAD(P)/FAD-dependent oxidoreductase [Desulfonatronum thioautotrophicum]|uniref:NAD(P)/FAD-dependent oxidoreductase n=1 Tax=Desulfonatronum thioautotrophicum TaxID=617001 RepID=UPI0005EB4600|nr:FAD-dependent oxidoreductase [Desulfonatronum thioautotrophicum]
MATSWDAVIIGAGVNGCAIAYNLAKRGLRVVILDKTDVCAQASGQNGGGVRQSARDPRELPLAMLSVSLFSSLAEELGLDMEYVQAGNLRLCTTSEQEKTMRAAVEQQRVDFGLDVRYVDRDELETLNPHIAQWVVGASYCPTDGHANPLLTTYAFARKARELGAELRTGETVTRIRLSRGAVNSVVTDREVYSTGLVINAAGIGGRAVANMVGLDFPMTPVFTEVLVTEAREPLFAQMIGTASSDFYGHQTTHGSFVWGGFVGYETFLHDGHHGGMQRPNYPEVASAICRAVLRYFPGLGELNVIRTWGGLIAQVADKVPVLGPVPEVPGYISATGFSGHGFGIAPAVGRVIGQAALGETPDVDLSPFAADRFGPVH